MLWEFIAVLAAGFAGAGIALSLRFLIKRLPKWIVPVAAGLAMLGFAIYSEYSWYSHTASRLPEGTVVVATVPHTAFYKPWSYVQPQILQFVALDTKSIKTLDEDNKQVTLYFFERRMKAQPLAVTLNCRQPSLQFDQQMQDNIIEAVCP